MKKQSFPRAIGASSMGFTAVLTFALAMLSGCEDGIQHLFTAKKIPLKGRRISLYGMESQTREKDLFSPAKTQVSPSPVVLWGQAGLNAQHHMGSCALEGSMAWPLVPVWFASVFGDATLPVSPVTSQQHVFVVDNMGAVSAFDWHGKRVWSVQVNRNRSFFGMGGGLATDGQTLYVTTPTGLVLALNCCTGKRLWQHTLNYPARNGPALLDHRLAIITLANQIVMLDARTGKELWEVQGFKDDTMVLGGSVPGMTSDCVVVGTGSGEVLALSLERGDRLWEQQLGTLVLEGEKNFRHIHACPVIVGKSVYIASESGKLVCFDLLSGEVVWSQDIHSGQTPVVLGDGLVTVTANGTCLALDRHTGKELWEVRVSQQKRLFGPIVAGGLIYVLSENGQLYGLDPAKKGKKVLVQSLKRTYTLAPIAVRGGLLFFSKNGTLSFCKRQASPKPVNPSRSGVGPGLIPGLKK